MNELDAVLCGLYAIERRCCALNGDNSEGADYDKGFYKAIMESIAFVTDLKNAQDESRSKALR